MLNRLPAELKVGRRFVSWQYQDRDGKKTKVPVSPSGGLARVNDPKSWGTFGEAISCYKERGLSGVGIVLSKNSGLSLVGVDLDHCIDDTGTLTPEALDIVTTLNSYSEITPSGHGLRVFVKGKLPGGARRKGPIEIYDDLRYLTLTGNHLTGTPKTVEARQEELIFMWKKYVGTPEPIKKQQPIEGGRCLPDDELLQKAMNAANGATFRDLYEGGLAGYPSLSEGDMALCSMLAFWTANDAGRIDNIYRQSGRYREKWDKVHVHGRTYGEETIRKAVTGTTEVYEGRKKEADRSVGIQYKPAPGGTPLKNGDILSVLFRWNDIALMNISTEWVLEKLIPKGAITLFFGSGGIGKSWLTAQIARAIAVGEAFGNLQTVKSHVCLVDHENPLSVVQDRSRKVGPAEDFLVWHLACQVAPPKLDSDQWVLYKQLPQGVLIFDTLRASHTGDENSSKDMALVLSRLKELRETGFTVVVLHHTAKGQDGTYKGSTAILDLADHVLSLEKQGKGEEDEFDPDAIYKFGCRIKTRFEPHHVFLSFDPANGFGMKDDPDIEMMKIMRGILDREGPLKQKDFRKVLEDQLQMKKARIFKLLKKGTGDFWETERGWKDNAIVYSALLSGFPVFPPYKGVENQKTNLDLSGRDEKHTSVGEMKTVDTHGFAGFRVGMEKTEKTDGGFQPRKFQKCHGL